MSKQNLQTLSSILKDQAIRFDVLSLSYINRLIPELASRKVVVFYKAVISETGQPKEKEIETIETQINELDITGSPLEYSFGNDTFQDTLIIKRRNWRPVEEHYVPLSRMEASWTVPIFAICDGKDSENTLFIGTLMEPRWHCTVHAGSIGFTKPSDIETNYSVLVNEHNKIYTTKFDVNMSTLKTYDLFGTSQETINCKELSKHSFDGYANLEISSSGLQSDILEQAAVCTMTIEIAAGHLTSALNELWQQMLLLNEFLTMLEQYQRKTERERYSVMPLQFPNHFSTPYAADGKDIINQLYLLLHGDSTTDDKYCLNYDNKRFMYGNEREQETDVPLQQYIDEVRHRENRDFTDNLWQLLIGCKSHIELTDCFHAVFEEILNDDFRPEMNSSNATRFAKIVSELYRPNAALPLLVGSLPLELLIDIGFRKLNRDYVYLLLSMTLIDIDEVKKKLNIQPSGEYDLQNYRKDLLTMGRIHICIDFLLLLQDRQQYSTTDLQFLFDHAFDLYTSENSPVKSFSDLAKNSIYQLTSNVPCTSPIVKETVKKIPTSWRFSLSSQTSMSKLTTITYYSRDSIFPPSVFPIDESDDEAEGYYATKVIYSSSRIS
ncbi:protein zwilch homolog isoform X2 [Orussus abietinus]|uniref:protein zwilch homolog isoform X2 n=1 Tax=Orussus abietinus TaxID=222816 RepID=UPI0006253E78|nr:protein zwilch homolog isoform X2 [Orussus abietinus]